MTKLSILLKVLQKSDMKRLLLIVCVTILLFSLFTLVFVSNEHASVFSFTKRVLCDCVDCWVNNAKLDDFLLCNQQFAVDSVEQLMPNCTKGEFEHANAFSARCAREDLNFGELDYDFVGRAPNCEVNLQKNLANFSTTAQSCVVMERNSGRILFQKDCSKRLPMASTTKIVTALTVLNNCSLDDVVVIPKEACGIEGSSIYLREGEKLTVKELLYGLMLRSGNDCAVALALHTSGSVERFADLMNQTVRELGCTNSNFVNPHGLHNDNHYTTAEDLAIITCKALQNKHFAEIVATKSVKIANDGYDYPRVLINKNKLLSNFDNADGVKTGYTKKAGRCFVGSATRGGMQVVVVVLNCGPMFEETAKMLDVAFANYQNVCIAPKNKFCGVIYRNNKPTYYYCDDAFSYPVASGERLTRKITLTEQTQTMDILLDGSVVKTIQLKATE